MSLAMSSACGGWSSDSEEEELRASQELSQVAEACEVRVPSDEEQCDTVPENHSSYYWWLNVLKEAAPQLVFSQWFACF